MAEPIYKMFAGRATEAWYALDEREQNELLKQVGYALEAVGGRRVMSCDSSWANEAYQFFGIEEFPDLEAVQAFTRALVQLDWYRYMEGLSLLGTKWGGM
ncbi:MAG: hypothetical protein JW910_07120 [Anaerolineae bacterium]|nr:hypothetical protein [Anaerolineae bacterium]